VFDCKLCPGKGSAAEIAGMGERMARWRVCRSCDFWLTCVGYRALGDQDPDGRRVLRVDGRHYMTWTEEQGALAVADGLDPGPVPPAAAGQRPLPCALIRATPRAGRSLPAGPLSWTFV
jgi:hypothetical protein